MFQFARLSPDRPIDSAGGNAALPALGFPIRESTGQRLFNASPWLIAVVHALLRLLMPRHPPCALTILTVIRPADKAGPVIPDTSNLANCAVFKVRRGAPPPGTPATGLSKLNSVCASRATSGAKRCASPARASGSAFVQIRSTC